MQIIGIKPFMSSLCDKKVDKYFNIMSQISTKYATQLFTKIVTRAIY
jgi:hypothetical protein